MAFLLAFAVLAAGCGGVSKTEEAADASGIPDGGADDVPGVDGSTGCAPNQVQVPFNGTAFCIDAEEVTRSEYREFLGMAAASLNGSACAWNVSFEPTDWGLLDDGDGLIPATDLDWCDASAFCTSRDAHLCGDLDGGPEAMSDFASASDAWFVACSGPAGYAYPYGDIYDPLGCNGSEGKAPRAAAAGVCEGGWPGILDMSGNVAEWENACDGAEGKFDNCRQRGGAFGSSSIQLRCGANFIGRRDEARANVGFRCCGPP